EMKRHYTNYFKGISHFKEWRTKLVTSFELNEIIETLDYIEKNAANFELV
ncbi:MAG: tRNA-dihydrouridine synthase B, partial [Psychromonas sp.]